ncbi:MAG TPA: hypothetical protein VJC10_00975 [Patescibacteria group bacterium]|nr:hypothetical protein [Patescibacteria group bacterium]
MVSHEARRFAPTPEDEARYDQRLNDIEIAMMRMVGERSLGGSDVERWRWDVPEITMKLRTTDGIERSIQASIVVDEETGRESVAVGVSAWRDDERTFTRVWNSANVANLRMNAREKTIQRAIERAYDRVLGWTRDDLTKQTSLQPLRR